jgi:hypothetical protein
MITFVYHAYHFWNKRKVMHEAESDKESSLTLQASGKDLTVGEISIPSWCLQKRV